MKKELLHKFLFAFLCVFLPAFMLFIFGPAEIFFANETEFEFVYGDFAGYLALLAVGGSALLGLVLMFLPEKIKRLVSGIIFGLSLAGYVQVMFLNKQLDLLGLNPEGYKVEITTQIMNAIIWLIILVAVVGIVLWKHKFWKQIVGYGSAFLIAIQLTALFSLVLTAGEGAYEYPKGTWHLSGEEQYTVSGKDNVIVIVLDYYSNLDHQQVDAKYPGFTEFMNDFTYYNNTDCNYYGTFPSIAHMLTGKSVDPTILVNEWCRRSWTDETTKEFYDILKANDYKINVYTPDLHYLLGTNSAELLKDTFSNVTNETQTVDVHYKLLWKTISKMAAYRMAPEALKTCFYTNGSEYTEIIKYVEDNIEHGNYDFYGELLSQGLVKDESSNYFTYIHLEGPHNYLTGEDGHYKLNATMEETIKGCMVVVEEYLEQLKELGVYDDATIIVTSDHGDTEDSQVIMYVKQPGEAHEKMQVTNAPISLAELRATIIDILGEDYSQFGPSFFDFSENEMRERTVWVRTTDMDYSIIDNYAEDRIGYANVYYGYTYTGGLEELLEQVEEGPTEIVPMEDSFF